MQLLQSDNEQLKTPKLCTTKPCSTLYWPVEAKTSNWGSKATVTLSKMEQKSAEICNNFAFWVNVWGETLISYHTDFSSLSVNYIYIPVPAGLPLAI